MPEAGTTAVLIEQVQGTRRTAEPAAQSAPRAADRMAKREVTGNADNGVQTGVEASLADSNRESMQDTSCAIAQVPSSEPRTFVDISDKSGGFTGCKEKEEEAHDLHGANSESTEIIDKSRTRNAKGNREPSDERIICEIPKKRRSRVSHAETTLEKPQDPVLATNDGPDPLFKIRQRKAQIAQGGICHPRMTRISQGMLSRSKALLWSASVAAGIRARAGS